MAIVAVNGGGNIPNGNAADGTSNTLMGGEEFVRSHVGSMAGDGSSAGNADGYAGSHLLYEDFVVPTTLGETDGEVLVLSPAPAGDSNEYVLSSVGHAATETSGAGPQRDDFGFDDDVILLWGSLPGAHDPGGSIGEGEESQGLWQISLPPAQAGQPHAFGQPVTFTFTVSSPGYAGAVLVAAGDVDGAQNNLKQIALATIDYDSSPLEGITDGTSNTLIVGEYARAGTTGSAQGDGAGIAWVSGEGGIRGADTIPEADWLLLL
jgi:hypothetical protein